MAVDKIETIPLASRNRAIDPIAKSFANEGLAPLVCSPLDLAKEAIANADAWNIPNLAPKLATRPIFVITSDDGLTSSNEAFVTALKKSGSIRVSAIHIATDHSYSDRRIELQTSILNWLGTL